MSTSELILILTNVMLEAAEYADWRELRSVERARKFATAVNRMVALMPKAVQLGGNAGESFVNDLQAKLKLLDKAEAFISQYEAAQSQLVYEDLRYYRD